MFKRVRICAAVVLVVAPTVAFTQSLPDPTQRTPMNAPASGPQGSQWTLQSTLVAADRRLAVINSQTVIVGDRVDGARVIDIQAYGVRLRTANGTLELKLTGDDPKITAGGGNIQ